MEAPVEAPVEQAPAPVEQPGAGSDPFTINEERLASLSPEQRAALDPVFAEWKTKAQKEIEARGKKVEEKYKPDLEKAQALTQLVQRPEFQQWWNQQQQAAMRQNPTAQGAIAQTRPQDIASNQEWQEALYDLNVNNDAQKFQALQARMFALMATPVVQQLRQGQEELKTTIEMKNLFEMHPDAKTLDRIGQDPSDPDSPSLLEVALNLADERKQPLEWGYRLAKRWADSMNVQAKQEAMGMVQGKKDSITSGPSTNRAPVGAGIVEVADSEELMSRSMAWSLDNPGQPMPKFVIRPPAVAQRDQRWSQRT